MLKGLQARVPDLVGTGLTAIEVSQAAESIAATAELRNAASAAGAAADEELVRVIARAVVARALAPYRSDSTGTGPAALYDREARDALVARLEAALSPARTRGLGDWIKDRLIGFTTSVATSFTRDRRQNYTGLSMPAVGDILFYQRRGSEISQLTRESLTACSPPVVAVGHSLGGIVLVDILSQANPPRVDLLVTVGSQSPLFYAVDALENLRLFNSIARPFTPWLNIYDQSDFLSYCAARIFNGVSGIEDVEVSSGVPFPESHGAYWHLDRTYELIRGSWEKISNGG
jgi:hypothetical protein